MYISSPSIPCTLHSTLLLLYSSSFFFLLAACRTLIMIWIAIHFTALYFTLLEYTPPLSGMNVLMNEGINEWMIKKKVRQPTRKQEVLCVCCMMYVRDGWDGSEWVRGIEEEEEEEEEKAELAEVLLIDCVICCCWKKNRRLSVLEASTATVYRVRVQPSNLGLGTSTCTWLHKRNAFFAT